MTSSKEETNTSSQAVMKDKESTGLQKQKFRMIRRRDGGHLCLTPWTELQLTQSSISFRYRTFFCQTKREIVGEMKVFERETTSFNFCNFPKYAYEYYFYTNTRTQFHSFIWRGRRIFKGASSKRWNEKISKQSQLHDWIRNNKMRKVILCFDVVPPCLDRLSEFDRKPPSESPGPR